MKNQQFIETQKALNDILADKQIFFIIGCQKSGTTWVESILNGHPQICCHGETKLAHLIAPVFSQAVEKYNKQHKAKKLGMLYHDAVVHLIRTTMAMLFHQWAAHDVPNVKCFGERTPEHALAIPILLGLFPEARFIHIIRDGRDGAVSGWFHNLKQKNTNFGNVFPKFSSYAQYFADKHWCKYIHTARQSAETIPDQYMEIRYEDLHQQNESNIKIMLQFLEVDADNDMICKCADAGSFKRLSGGRERGQVDNKSHFRKGIVGDWKTHFDEDAYHAFMRIAGDLIHDLGYEAK